jgi:hypothetical protein
MPAFHGGDAAWGPCDCAADVTGDGVVGVEDLLILPGQWG